MSHSPSPVRKSFMNTSESPSKLGILGDEISLDKITPEVAAKIVKHFILPMFENAPSSKYGKRLG